MSSASARLIEPGILSATTRYATIVGDQQNAAPNNADRPTAAKQLRQAFGEVVRQCRLKKALSQEALAFEAGLTRNYISIIELGQQSPTLDTVEALARALGMSASSLIARAERDV